MYLYFSLSVNSLYLLLLPQHDTYQHQSTPPLSVLKDFIEIWHTLINQTLLVVDPSLIPYFYTKDYKWRRQVLFFEQMHLRQALPDNLLSSSVGIQVKQKESNVEVVGKHKCLERNNVLKQKTHIWWFCGLLPFAHSTHIVPSLMRYISVNQDIDMSSSPITVHHHQRMGKRRTLVAEEGQICE